MTCLDVPQIESALHRRIPHVDSGFDSSIPVHSPRPWTKRPPRKKQKLGDLREVTEVCQAGEFAQTEVLDEPAGVGVS